MKRTTSQRLAVLSAGMLLTAFLSGCTVEPVSRPESGCMSGTEVGFSDEKVSGSLSEVTEESLGAENSEAHSAESHREPSAVHGGSVSGTDSSHTSPGGTGRPKPDSEAGSESKPNSRPDSKPDSKPEQSQEQSSSEQTSREPAGRPEEKRTAEEQLIFLSKTFGDTPYYRSEIVGQVDAKIYKQQIHDIHIKCGREAYMRAVSTSALVNVGKEAFFSGGKVVMRDADDVKNDKWSNQFRTCSLKEYCASNGNTPLELSNYLIAEDTIRSAKMQKNSDGGYTVTAEIDPVRGTRRYAVRMKNYGGLKELPVFSRCSLTVTCDRNGNIRSLKARDEYKINKLGFPMGCVSTLTETFKDYSQAVTIPTASLFRSNL